MMAQRTCGAARWPVWRALKLEPETVVKAGPPRHPRQQAGLVLELALLLVLARWLPGPGKGK